MTPASNLTQNSSAAAPTPSSTGYSSSGGSSFNANNNQGDSDNDASQDSQNDPSQQVAAQIYSVAGNIFNALQQLNSMAPLASPKFRDLSQAFADWLTDALGSVNSGGNSPNQMQTGQNSAQGQAPMSQQGQ